MRRSLCVVVAAAGLLLATGVAQAAPTDQEAVPGFYRGRVVHYLDFGPIKLVSGNRIAPIWAVTNGTKQQHNVIDTVPGQRDYSPLWKVIMVTWKAGITPRTLRSEADVEAAVRAREVTLDKTSTVVNCPVLGFGQEKVAGFYRGKGLSYLDLGPVKLGPGNKVAPIWAFTNGADGQRNVVDTVPGEPGYTPLWAVRMVTWKNGVVPRVLRSAAEVERAVGAGDATLERTETVVNCPVV